MVFKKSLYIRERKQIDNYVRISYGIIIMVLTKIVSMSTDVIRHEIEMSIVMALIAVVVLYFFDNVDRKFYLANILKTR